MKERDNKSEAFLQTRQTAHPAISPVSKHPQPPKSKILDKSDKRLEVTVLHIFLSKDVSSLLLSVSLCVQQHPTSASPSCHSNETSNTSKSTPTLWQLSEDLDRLFSKRGREKYESPSFGLQQRDHFCFSRRGEDS